MNPIYCPSCRTPLDSRQTLRQGCPTVKGKLTHFEVFVHTLFLLVVVFKEHRSGRKTLPPTPGRGAGANPPPAPAIHTNHATPEPAPTVVPQDAPAT